MLFLQQHSKEKVIVYFLTCNCVDFYALALKRLGPKFLPGLQVSAASRVLLIGAAYGRAQGCIPVQQYHAQGQSHEVREGGRSAAELLVASGPRVLLLLAVAVVAEAVEEQSVVG